MRVLHHYSEMPSVISHGLLQDLKKTEPGLSVFALIAKTRAVYVFLRHHCRKKSPKNNATCFEEGRRRYS